MKTSHFSLSVCFILFSIYINSLRSAAAELPLRGPNSLLSAGAEEPAPVLDIEGNELQAGVHYYIVSAIRGAGGGGLTQAGVGNQTCPLSVLQEPADINRGLPLYFRPVNPEEGVVRLSTDQNIIFDPPFVKVCENYSNVWRVYYDESTREDLIKTGAEEGNPGPGTVSNWFKIEGPGGHYTLRFCPEVCNFCSPTCKYVGLMQDRTRRLALIDVDNDVQPFGVVFVKA